MKGYAWQKCEDGPKSVKVDKNFFKEATTREFQECFKNHHVEFDGKTLREKQCNVTVSTLWSKSPKITGFFQKCTPRQPTSDFDTELAMIKQSRTPACERHNLEVMNLETNTLKCPSGTNETLMKEYDHTLPDYAIDFECLTHKITVILKDVVTISTYWCKPNDPNQPNGLLYGGFYRRGRPNSYIGTEGCGDNMREAKLFHDTTLCVHNDITNKDLKNTAELRSIIGRNGERVNCGSKESKIFLSTINGEKMYACIYKKGGYFNAPSIAPVTLPFNDYLDMFEAHSKNVIIVDGKVTVLTRARDLSNIFGDKCDSQNIVMPSTSTDASEAKADKGPSIFDPTLIPILIVAVLVIVGFLVVKKVLPNNHVPLR
uniref:Glycoprotein n=1 Tax=Panagrellus redivivus TaxID=6233 RepID=A0A7E4UQ64_PANRE